MKTTLVLHNGDEFRTLYSALLLFSDVCGGDCARQIIDRLQNSDPANDGPEVKILTAPTSSDLLASLPHIRHSRQPQNLQEPQATSQFADSGGNLHPSSELG